MNHLPPPVIFHARSLHGRGKPLHVLLNAMVQIAIHRTNQSDVTFPHFCVVSAVYFISLEKWIFKKMLYVYVLRDIKGRFPNI